MQIDYALFDPSSDQGGGNYWTWSAGELPPALRDAVLYRQFAVKHLHPDVNTLNSETLWGGIVHLAAETSGGSGWVVLYRYFDGGRDRKNRPGRYVMLTAWIKANDIKTVSERQIFDGLRPVFDTEVFRHVLARSKELPIPAPAELSENISLRLPAADGSEPLFADNRFNKHIKIENSVIGIERTESAVYLAWKEEQYRKSIEQEKEKEKEREREKEKAKEKETKNDKKEAKKEIKEGLPRPLELERQVQHLNRKLRFYKRMMWIITALCLLVLAILLAAVLLKLPIEKKLPPSSTVLPNKQSAPAAVQGETVKPIEQLERQVQLEKKIPTSSTASPEPPAPAVQGETVEPKPTETKTSPDNEPKRD